MDRKSIENLPRIHPILYHGYLYFVSTFPLNTTTLPILLCKLNFFDAKFEAIRATFCAHEKAGNDFFVEKKVKKKKEEKKYQLLSERRVTDRYE